MYADIKIVVKNWSEGEKKISQFFAVFGSTPARRVFAAG